MKYAYLSSKDLLESSNITYQHAALAAWIDWNKATSARRSSSLLPPSLPPLSEGTMPYQVLNAIVSHICICGTPPNVQDIVDALGIPSQSRTLVYRAVEVLRRDKYLANKEYVEDLNLWGQQRTLIPEFKVDGCRYDFRDKATPRSAKKIHRAKKSSKQLNLKLKNK